MRISRTEMLAINRRGWDEIAATYYGGTALPLYGPLAQTEDDLQLIDDLRGKAVLEIGYGSGHSLCWLRAERLAEELWGLDLSSTQRSFAQDLLRERNVPATLLLGSMDENPGIPEDHFDCVVSIYGLGWSPDLPRTLALIHSYLKPGGTLVFSWEHPVYRCLRWDEATQGYLFATPYLEEGPQLDPSFRGSQMVLYPRTLSSFLNAVSSAGLILEHLVESPANAEIAREIDLLPGKWYSLPRAELMPTTFIVKARKRMVTG